MPITPLYITNTHTVLQGTLFNDSGNVVSLQGVTLAMRLQALGGTAFTGTGAFAVTPVKQGTIAAVSGGAIQLVYTTSGSAPLQGDVFTLDVGTLTEQVTVASVSGVSSPYTLTVPPIKFQHNASTAATTAGQFTYTFSDDDVATAGTYEMQVDATFGDGTVLPIDAQTLVILPKV